MLGFSPTASTAIGDDGSGSSAVDVLSGDSILAGTPTVSQSSLAQNSSLQPVSITTEEPSVTPSSIATDSQILADSILTGAPVVGIASVITTHTLSGISIVTGNPVVGSIVLNPPERRFASLSGSSNKSLIDSSINKVEINTGYNKVA
jgi:hypothetical protein